MTPISDECPRLLEDLIIEILIRLPVKALFRFKSVCKTWHTVISSSQFENQHYVRESNCTKILVWWTGFFAVRDNSSRMIEYVDLSSFSLFLNETLESHMKVGDGLFEGADAICGPCNGIICVKFNDNRFGLWNPATRKFWPIPKRSSSNVRKHVEFSFWIDPVTSEFKIFYISDMEEEENQHEWLVMFSSCNDSWTLIELPIYHDDNLQLQVQRCVRYSVINGIYYILKHDESMINHTIIAYDIPKDLFQEIKMPKIETISLKEIKVDLYGDRLALFALYREGFLGGIAVLRTEIWVMQEKGYWSKLFNVGIPSLCQTLGFWKGNEIFISHYTDECMDYSELMIYDLVTFETRKLDVEKAAGAYDIGLFPLCYNESLKSLRH